MLRSVPVVVALLLAGGVLAAPADAATPPPVVNTVSPVTGTVGTTVYITGLRFASDALVRFGGVPAVRPVVKNTSITAVVPPDAGTGPVTVTQSTGQATDQPVFTVTPGVAGSATTSSPGAAFALHAVGLGALEAVDVYFDATDVALATTTSSGTTDPTVTVPVTATPGAHTWTLVGRRSGTALQTRVTLHTDWPQFGLDATHRGTLNTENVLNPQHVGGLDEVWRTPAYQVTTVEPAVVGGVVYQLAGSQVFAYDLATGAVRWMRNLPESGYGGIAVSGTLALVTTYSGVVHAMRTTTGADVWTATLAGTFNTNGAIGGGSYVIGSNEHKVFAVDLATGAAEWTAALDDVVRTTPAIAGGRVYVGTIGSHEYALDLASGAQVWSYTTGNEVLGSATLSNGVVYFGSLDDRFYAVRATTGQLLWSFTAAGQVWSTPAVANGVVYFGDTTEHAYALDAATGAQRWTTPVDDSLYGRVSVADGVVYYTGSGTTRALWASDGEQLWEVHAGNMVGGAVLADGTVTVADAVDHVLVHYELPVGLRPHSAVPDPRTLQRSDAVPHV